MKYFLVAIDTDEAEPGELVEAIKNKLGYLDFPDGSGLFVDNPVVEYCSRDPRRLPDGIQEALNSGDGVYRP